MEIKQRFELKRLMLPSLQQALKILPLSMPELKELISAELVNNPFLEEVKPKNPPSKLTRYKNEFVGKDADFASGFIVKQETLKESLSGELRMFAKDELDVKIGEEIIGNIDENGYLRIKLEEISAVFGVPLARVEEILKLIQQFEPAGIAARSISECLLLQLASAGELDETVKSIVENHLEDIAKKNYTRIAKCLKQPLENIMPSIKKILKLDPKPARNYSTEQPRQVIPDVMIFDDGDELEVTINDEDIPSLNINKDYKKVMKNKDIEPQTRQLLARQLKQALELLNAINKRQSTLRKIVDYIVEVQYDAIKENLSYLKPLTLSDVAKKLDMHESTISRAIMNKYVRLPYGTVALKDFFSSHVQDRQGQSISSNFVKMLIKELIEKEDKKHPLSDHDICRVLSETHNLNISRRTVTKYREGLKIFSTVFRREK